MMIFLSGEVSEHKKHFNNLDITLSHQTKSELKALSTTSQQKWGTLSLRGPRSAPSLSRQLPELFLKSCWCFLRQPSSNPVVDTPVDRGCQPEDRVLSGLQKKLRDINRPKVESQLWKEFSEALEKLSIISGPWTETQSAPGLGFVGVGTETHLCH